MEKVVKRKRNSSLVRIVLGIPSDLRQLLKQIPYDSATIIRYAINKAISTLSEELEPIERKHSKLESYHIKLDKNIADFVSWLKGEKRVKFRYLMEKYAKELAEEMIRAQEQAKKSIIKEEELYLQELTKGKVKIVEIENDV